MADEVAGGDVGNAEELGEAGGVGALADSRAAEENPLDIPALARTTVGGQRRGERRRERVPVRRRGFRAETSS